MTPDVNVLVAAVRADHAHRAAARGRLAGEGFDRDFKKLLGRSHFTLLDPAHR